MKRSACLLTVLSLLTVSGAWAESPTLQATLDRSSVSLNESATLSVTLSGDGDLAEPQLPPLPGLTVQETGRAQTTTIVNGAMSSQETLQYTLTPQHSGRFTIGPITARSDGKEVATTPLQLEVPASPPSAAPTRLMPARAEAVAARGPAFLTAEIDDKTPYVGQSIHYVMRFYHIPGVTLGDQAQYPNTTGFIAGEPAPQRTYSTTLEGTAYDVTELSIPLSPTSAGTFTVGPAHVRCVIPFQGRPDPNDIFSLLGQAQEKDLSTPSLTVTVRSTPSAGRPADFTGGVGHFTLQAKTDGSLARVGQPLSLELTVEGSGNLELLQAPPLPTMSDFKLLGVSSSGGKAESRHFDVTLVPTMAGNLTIPAISMSSFDPTSGRYQSATTRPLTLTVAPGPQNQSADGDNPSKLRPIHKDLSPLATQPLTRSRLFLSLQTLPLFFLGAAWLAWRPRRVRPKHISPLRRARAELRLVPALAALPPILYRYLSEKLGQPVAALTSTQLRENLASRGATEDQADRFMSLLARAEQARYSIQRERAGADNAAAVAETLLNELERSLR